MVIYVADNHQISFFNFCAPIGSSLDGCHSKRHTLGLSDPKEHQESLKFI